MAAPDPTPTDRPHHRRRFGNKDECTKHTHARMRLLTCISTNHITTVITAVVGVVVVVTMAKRATCRHIEFKHARTHLRNCANANAMQCSMSVHCSSSCKCLAYNRISGTDYKFNVNFNMDSCAGTNAMHQRHTNTDTQIMRLIHTI